MEKNEVYGVVRHRSRCSLAVSLWVRVTSTLRLPWLLPVLSPLSLLLFGQLSPSVSLPKTKKVTY